MNYQWVSLDHLKLGSYICTCNKVTPLYIAMYYGRQYKSKGYKT